MAELVQANWVLLVIALAIGILVAWWVFAANRKTQVEIETKDETGPARRNQALIDAPAAVNRERTEPPPLATAFPEMEPLAEPTFSITPEPEPEPRTPAEAEAVLPLAPEAAPDGDELSRIKGLGPKLQAQLKEMGITSIAQIAAWDDAEIDRVDAQLGRFEGRIRRDDWVGQARLLEAGDIAAYESRFGRT